MPNFILILSGIFGESPKFWLFPWCYGDGDGDSPHNGDFRGKIPKKTQNSGTGMGKDFLKVLGKLWGRGQSQFRGVLGVKSPKISVFWGGDKGRILGDFPLYSIQGYDRCIQLYLLFRTNKKKSGVSFRCCQVYLKVLRGCWLPLDVFRCILA